MYDRVPAVRTKRIKVGMIANGEWRVNSDKGIQRRCTSVYTIEAEYDVVSEVVENDIMSFERLFGCLCITYTELWVLCMPSFKQHTIKYKYK